MDSVAKATPLGGDILSLIDGVLKTHSEAARCPEQLAVDADGPPSTHCGQSFLNEEQGQGPLLPSTVQACPVLPGPQNTGSTKQPASESSPGVWTLTQQTQSESYNVRNECSGHEGWKEAQDCEGVTRGLLR